MKTLFGNVTESVELVQRKQLDDGRIQTVSKEGKLTITTTSNVPSVDTVESDVLEQQNINSGKNVKLRYSIVTYDTEFRITKYFDGTTDIKEEAK